MRKSRIYWPKPKPVNTMSETKDKYKLVKKVENAQHLENGDGKIRVVLDGTLSYPHIITPQGDDTQPDKPPRYNLVLLGELDSPAHKLLEAALKKAGKNYFPELKKVNTSLKNGNDKPDENGYEGKFTIGAANTEQPQLFIGRSPMDQGEERKFYPGAQVRVVATLWKQNNQHGKRVNLSLDMVQWTADGERLGGRAPIASDDYLADIDIDDEEDEHDPLA